METMRSRLGSTTRLYGINSASGNAGSALLAERTTLPLVVNFNQTAGHAALFVSCRRGARAEKWQARARWAAADTSVDAYNRPYR